MPIVFLMLRWKLLRFTQWKVTIIIELKQQLWTRKILYFISSSLTIAYTQGYH
jgi:hypothetical protein